MAHSQFKNKNVIIGSWINSASPIIAEIMSISGFDYLVVDAEHSAVDVTQAQAIFQAIRSGNPNCVPIIRLPGNLYEQTNRYLDAGAQGVIAPLINTSAEARELVRSVKYPPLGDRGVGFGRSHGYGIKFDEYMKSANEEIMICVQIEHINALNNIDSIFSVDGIDGAFIGPYDLSASMGITAQFNHPEYIKAVDIIVTKCKEYNISLGYHVVQPDPELALSYLNKGVTMLAYSLDITMLSNQCLKGLSQLKEGIKNDS
jgi:2-dehydro-3-deoxyglucarate aldolase